METASVEMVTRAGTVLRNVTTNTGATTAPKSVYVTTGNVIKKQECVFVTWALEDNIARLSVSVDTMVQVVE